MILTLIPIRHDTPLSLARLGETLIVGGAALDFTDLAEGETRDAAGWGSDWLLETVRRRDGVLHLTLALPHGATAPPETRAPLPLRILRDGPVDLPPHALPEPGRVPETNTETNAGD